MKALTVLLNLRETPYPDDFIHEKKKKTLKNKQ